MKSKNIFSIIATIFVIASIAASVAYLIYSLMNRKRGLSDDSYINCDCDFDGCDCDCCDCSDSCSEQPVTE